MKDEELERAAEVYEKVKSFLWIGVDQTRPEGLYFEQAERSWQGKLRPREQKYSNGMLRPHGPFVFSAERPAPYWQDKDFPNPDYEWGHPDFKSFIRGYQEWGIDIFRPVSREEWGAC